MQAPLYLWSNFMSDARINMDVKIWEAAENIFDSGVGISGAGGGAGGYQLYLVEHA